MNTPMREFHPNNLPKIEDWGLPDGVSIPPMNHPQLYLEIGCGTGDHALSFAQFNPDKHLIAIERTNNKFKRFYSKFQKFTPNNLTPIQADAIIWSSQHLNENSLSGCFILYPNPYPKNKQSNLRWHNMPYFQHLIKLLKPGAHLVLATNIESYAKEFKQVILEHHTSTLKLSEFSIIDPQNFLPRTAFEKKYLARGETCYNLIYTKNSN